MDSDAQGVCGVTTVKKYQQVEREEEEEAVCADYQKIEMKNQNLKRLSGMSWKGEKTLQNEKEMR